LQVRDLISDPGRQYPSVSSTSALHLSVSHLELNHSVCPRRALPNQEKTKSWFDYVHARYIPNIVLERFGTADARPLLAAEHTRFDAAVAFVDISGFTKLSEKLMQDHGTGGAELLNKIVSAYFEQLIEVIVQWGGEYVSQQIALYMSLSNKLNYVLFCSCFVFCKQYY
jgi:hypothetical protein